jgi:hypothetical protein
MHLIFSHHFELTTPRKQNKKEKKILTFSLVVGLEINVDLSSTSRMSGCHIQNFSISPKRLTWEPLLFYLFLAPNCVRSRKGIKQFKANSFFILASKMLKVHCYELIVYATG